MTKYDGVADSSRAARRCARRRPTACRWRPPGTAATSPCPSAVSARVLRKPSFKLSGTAPTLLGSAAATCVDPAVCTPSIHWAPARMATPMGWGTRTFDTVSESRTCRSCRRFAYRLTATEAIASFCSSQSETNGVMIAAWVVPAGGNVGCLNQNQSVPAQFYYANIQRITFHVPSDHTIYGEASSPASPTHCQAALDSLPAVLLSLGGSKKATWDPSSGCLPSTGNHAQRHLRRLQWQAGLHKSLADAGW